MAIVGVGTVPIVPDMKGFAAKVNAGASTGLSGLTSKFAAVGKAAGLALGASVVVGLGALTKLGSTFDKEYDKIRVGTGATGKDLEKLKGTFKNVLKDVPTDFGRAGTAVADLNTRLGLTGKPLETVSKRVLEMNRLLGGDLTSQIAGVTRVMGDWGIKNKEIPGTLDKLFRASQATGISIESLSEKTVKFGAPMRQLGFSFEETAALLGKFEKEGVNVDLVMGSMRIALGKMAREGEPAQETFKRVTEQIKAAGSASEANSLALDLFGAKAGPDMAAAIREGRFDLGALFDQVANGSETILSAAEDTESFGEKWQKLRNRLAIAFEPAAMAVFDALGKAMDYLGEVVGPALFEMLGRLRDKLVPVAAWFANAKEAAGFLIENFKLGTLSAETFGEIMTLAFGERTLGFFTRLGRTMGALVDVVRRVAGIVRAGLGRAFETLADVGGKLFRLFDKHKELFAIIGAGILHFLIPALVAKVVALTAATTGWLAMAAAAIVANAPLIAVSLAIGALVAGVIYAYKNFETFRNIVDTVADVLQAALGIAVRFIVNLWNNQLLPAGKAIASFMVNTLWPAVQTAWDGILKVIQFAWQRVIQPIFTVLKWYVENVLVNAFKLWKLWVVDIVMPLIVAAIRDAWGVIKPVLDLLVGFFNSVLMPVFNHLWGVVSGAFKGIRDVISAAWKFIRPVLQTVIDFIWKDLGPVWEGMRAMAEVAFKALPGIVGAALRLVGGLVAGFLSGVGSIADALKLGNIGKVLKDGAASARKWGVQGVPTSSVRTGGQGNAFADGGPIRGRRVRKDNVPIWGMAGEWVMKRDAVDHYGPGFMKSVNEMKFAAGGLIPDIDIAGLADGVVDAVKGIGTAALDRVWPKLPVPSNITGIPPGGVNFMRDAALKLIRDKEASMASQSGGGFTRSGGGGPAGQYTAGMQRARADILNLFGPMSVGGYSNRNIAGTNQRSQHAMWRAWDFMVGLGNVSKGNAVSRHLIANASKYGLKGLIWNDQKNFGSGWGPYGHPGGGRSATLQHKDHVHAEFFRDGGLVHLRNFDGGGTLAPGWNAVRNDTGSNETVVPSRGGPLVGQVFLNSPEDVDEFWRRAEFSVMAGRL